MFCKYCGNELPEEANFCPKCGKTIENEAAHEEAPAQALNVTEIFGEEAVLAAERERARDELGGKILRNSIMGLAFASSFILSVVGLIFSIIARCQVKEYTRKYGETSGRASVGKGLSIGGLAFSIFAMVYMFICVLYGVLIALLAIEEPSMYFDASMWV
ncbi:MAG: zinc ribbon domain-containing protein [Clostridia bacterium]|nr:zinc ribbon domain-containing protein [Clostridia bacterium]